MLLPQTKEREYRFKLALRMGLPIFALILAFISHTLISNYETLQSSFFSEAIVLVLVSIYFIFYLIYNGFKVKITDDISGTFTREYLYEYLQKEIKTQKEYTLILITIDNLSDINNIYGIKNGDRVLKGVVKALAKHLQKEGIENFPIGHIKGGDFILGLEGAQEKYIHTVDLLCLKFSDFTLDNIEVKISSAIVDTSYSKELDYLIEYLFELQEKRKDSKNGFKEDEINPNELERSVIKAIKEKSVIAMSQDIFEGESIVLRECFIKLQTDTKMIFPKTYLKVINKLGLGVDFDLMILENIADKYHSSDMRCALNISPTSLRNDTFLLRVREILEQKNIKIMFVLSEMEYYSHISKYKRIIESLQTLGVKFAIDRLGSIHTSFLYLRELSIDVVRFDTYYSKEEKLKEYQNILEGFCTMAHSKGVKTWIKNIETQEAYTLAKNLGIDYIQGKYLSQLEKK
jgi:EAL domain-containing protein (putative c-di-GMP-specific phosphodiesterase class I)/GGDEF domain-containing protein